MNKLAEASDGTLREAAMQCLPQVDLLADSFIVARLYPEVPWTGQTHQLVQALAACAGMQVLPLDSPLGTPPCCRGLRTA